LPNLYLRTTEQRLKKIWFNVSKEFILIEFMNIVGFNKVD